MAQLGLNKYVNLPAELSLTNSVIFYAAVVKAKDPSCLLYQQVLLNMPSNTILKMPHQ